MKWDRIEHTIWNELKRMKIQNRPLILTISGGLDSMALLHIFCRLSIQNPLIVAHFHHGKSDQRQTTKFRSDSLNIVRKYFIQHQKNNWKFETQKYAGKPLRSEDQFRKARNLFVEKIRSRNPNSVVVTGHHLGDELETQVLKLIRGSGTGLSRFKKWNGEVYRPLLEFSKANLRFYAMKHNLCWIEDPSNKSEEYLRNWVRNNWLQALENRQSGFLSSFARGLSQLVADKSYDLNFADSFQMILKMEIQDSKVSFILDRKKFKNSPLETRQNLIYVVYQRAIGAHNEAIRSLDRSRQKNPQFWEISLARIKEIYKRLDKNQKGLTFNMGPLKALTSEETIVLEFDLSY